MQNNNLATKCDASDDLRLYTVPEVAKKLRVKKSYVYELIYSQRLQSIRLSPRRIRVPESALKAFIKKEIGIGKENIDIVQPHKGV